MDFFVFMLGKMRLIRAVRNNDLQMIETILQDQTIADPKEVAIDLLHIATVHGKIEVVKLLVDKYHCPVDTKLVSVGGFTPLHIACKEGHIDIVRMLVTEYSADLNACDNFRQTPLHLAALGGQIGIVKCLINEFNCDPNTKRIDGSNTLLCACFKGHIKLVKTLLTSYRLNPLSADNNGNTALHYAASIGAVDILDLLITKYLVPVDSRNKSKKTPLHVACNRGKFEVVKILVTKYKADLNACDENSCTPLLNAALNGQTDIIECLIDDFNCDTNAKCKDGRNILHCICLNRNAELIDPERLLRHCLLDPLLADDGGDTPLHLPTGLGRKRRIELVEMLLTRYHLDPLSADNRGNTALHYAALIGAVDIVELLITKYHVPVDIRNKKKETPLHFVCRRGKINIVKILVTKFKADVNACDEHSCTPLHDAALYGQTDVVKCLIDKFNCDRNTKTKDGRNVLHCACLSRNTTELMETLLRHRLLDPMLADNDGNTPLHLPKDLGRKGRIELVETLLTHYHLDPLSADNSGNTAAHYAALIGAIDILDMLNTKYLVPVDIRNKNKETPLHLACRRGKIDIVKLLVTKFKADVNACDKYNGTPLLNAALYGQTEVVKCLIDEFNCDRNAKYEDGRNVLHCACLSRDTEAIETVMRHSLLDPSLAGDGNTPLHLTVDLGRKGNIKLVKALLTHYHLDPLSADNRGNTALHHAALIGAIDILDMLITEYKVPVDIRNKNKETPLHLACRSGKINTVKLLVTKFKADTNACDEYSCTPLHDAAIYGQTDVVKCLIDEFNCDRNAKSKDGRNILHCACLSRNTGLMKTLLRHCLLDPLLADDDGNTPLHLPTELGHNGNFELVETLLTHYHLDPLSADNRGNTALHHAALIGAIDILNLLITKYKVPVDIRNKNKETPLHLACRSGKIDIVKILATEYNADLNACGKYSDTPLHNAALYGQTDIIKFLIDEFNCDRNAKSKDGKNILHCACLSRNTELMETLLRHHPLLADGDDDDTPLHFVAGLGHNGCIELVETLLAHYHLDPLSADNNGDTALHYAALIGAVDIVDLLITKYHVPVNIRNKKMETPLHLACRRGKIGLVKILVTRYKADLSACDEHSCTPLHDAALYGQTDVVKCLIDEFNCDRNAKSIDGRNILHCACFSRNTTELMETLLRHRHLDPMLADDDGNTLLHLPKDIGRKGRIELIETLLTQYGLNPLSSDSNGNTALHYAALIGAMDILDLLITKYKVPVNARNKKNETPLHLACGSGKVDMVKVLVCNYKANLNACDRKSNTPLHIAALNGQLEVIKCLIDECNCDPKQKGIDGCNILHLACLDRSTKLIEILLSHLDELLAESDDDSSTNSNTPLHYVTSLGCKGSITLVETLLTHYHLDPLSADNSGKTPLHYAALIGAVDIVDLLITKYHVPVDIRNKNKETPLHFACRSGKVDVVKALVSKYKADLNACDESSNTSLHNAALTGQSQVVKCLIDEFKCNPNTNRKDGSNTLHCACLNGHTELVETLLTQYHLDPLSSDNNGNTALHYAAHGDAQQLVELLITKYGVPIDCKNKSKEVPLHIACRSRNFNVFKLLVTKYIQADLNACNEGNKTPLDEAGETDMNDKLTKVAENLYKVCNTNYGNNSAFCYGSKEMPMIHQACKDGNTSLVKLLINTLKFSPATTDRDGNTTLHISAKFGQTSCIHMLLHNHHVPIFLRNKSAKTAMDVASSKSLKETVNSYLQQHSERQIDYKKLQALANEKYSGEHTLTRVFVLGNKRSGKSTLIESLKKEGLFSSLIKVTQAKVPLNTSGIIPSTHISKSIGRVLYYDFAGDQEYYSSHSAILSNLMQSQIGINVFLIVVNYHKVDSSVCEEVGYWLHFVSNHTKTASQCEVQVVGSHVDMISTPEADRKAKLVSQFIQKYLKQHEKCSVKFQVRNEYLTMNCQQPSSARQIHTSLVQIVKDSTNYRLSAEPQILLGLLIRDFENVAICKPEVLIEHIKRTQIYLPSEMEQLHPIVSHLHALGLLMIINGRNSTKFEESLLLLDIHKVTNIVHKVLFSDENPHSAESDMGVLTQSYLKSILPKDITVECLIQLQYCQELSHTEVKFKHTVVAEDSNAPTLFYFPALCSTERKKTIRSPSNYTYRISWYLKCVEQFDYFLPRFLHVLLLRLAYSYAPSKHYTWSAEASLNMTMCNHGCIMWKNGIHWLMEKGVECCVENVENGKGIIVIIKSEETLKSVCTEMLVKIIKEILQVKKYCCNEVKLEQYLINSDNPMSHLSDKNKLYLESDICRVLKNRYPSVLSVNRKESWNVENISSLSKYIVYDAEQEKYTLSIDLEHETVILPTHVAAVAEAVQESTKKDCTEEQIIDCKLSEHHHSILSECLAEHSSKWEDIASALGFRPSELDNIKAQPSLFYGAPKTFLTKMLAEWLQWAPGDARESKSHATLVGLRDALTKVGLKDTFKLIITRLSDHE